MTTYASFRDVDGHDPAAAAEFLTLASRQPAIAAHKEASLSSLRLAPGERALDVGCGLGDEVRAMARAVAPGGSAVGIDVSETLVARARERAEEGLDATFVVGDAYAVPFDDASFDAVRVDRVLHLLDRPGAALTEMARVLRPEGRVAVIEPDWRSLRIEGIDADLAERAFEADAAPAAEIGRRLPALLDAAGFVDVTHEPLDGRVRDLAVARVLFRLDDRLEGAVAAERISAAERARVAEQLEAAAQAGTFAAQLRGALVGGRRPTTLRPCPARARERVLERARSFLDRHARGPTQRDVMRRALVEVEQIGGDRIPCLHLPLAVYEAEARATEGYDAEGGDAIAVVTVLAEAGIYALDHLADGELGPHWEGVGAGQVQLASVGFIGALPYLAIDELDVDAPLKVALHADLARAYVAIWDGQAGDLASDAATPEAALDVVRAKTGARRAVYARLAARHAGADDARCDLWAQLGEALGVVRQLSSDVLDLAGEPRASRDLASGVLTWPLAWVRSQLSEGARDDFDALLRAARDDPSAREAVVETVVARGAMMRARIEIIRQVETARAVLKAVEPTPSVAVALEAMLEDAANRFTLAVTGAPP